VGLQWGDEGKGKIVDLLSESADLVVRFSGGANAGHSVVRRAGEEVFALHLLPSGILREDALCVIANGVVLDPEILLQEIEGLSQRGIQVNGKLKISGRAHLVMDYHKAQDRLSEEALGKAKIGTTIRGIGPCYGDKVARSHALRVTDLMHMETLREKLAFIVSFKNKYFQAMYENAEPIRADELYDKCMVWSEALKPYITDTTALLHQSWGEKKSILFEGAQGTLLDLDHGTFPFVTSSNASAVGLAAATGVPAKAVDRFLGVVKAYTSRVGAGPFPTEQDNEIGNTIREKGHEYGTTTGRPRRCGWFDGVSVSYAVKIGGIDEIALLHLDTLSGMEELKICTAYRHQGRKLEFFPAEANILGQIDCEYVTMPGFQDDLTTMTDFDQLPENAKNYIKQIETILDRPVKIIGVGPGRDQTLIR
jgi:adenylosuccinate synthase